MYFQVVLACLVLTLSGPAAADVFFRFNPDGLTQQTELFPKSGKGFTNRKLTYSSNRIDLVRDALQGHEVIEFQAERTRGNKVSKSSLVHQGFDVQRGDVLVIDMEVMFLSDRLEGLFLADVECTDCWPKRSLVKNKSPGVRLYIDEGTRNFAVDRGKIGHRSSPIRSKRRAAPIPRNEWIALTWYIELSDTDEARTVVTVNGETYLDGRGATLMNDRVFRRHGIKLRRFAYDYLEIGLTANATGQAQGMRVGSVELRIE